MAKTYRIHPGIGIARIGNSPDAMFLAAETPDGLPADFSAGQTSAFSGYKDANGFLKRQGARFRVFEYDTGPGGQDIVREITAAEANIEWRVQIANTKSAANALADVGGFLRPLGPPRNPDANRADLAITPVLPPIAGVNGSQLEAPSGQFRGRPVKIAELKTDVEGRLVVLGGHGTSAAHPVATPINSFANNPDWFDDVGDGSVDAVVTFPGQAPLDVEFGSWVIIAPPDFAPGVKGLASLFDVALSAAAEASWPPPAPSYQNDILPILQRAIDLRWVQRYGSWNSFPKDFALLGTIGGQADAARLQAYNKLINVQQGRVLNNFNYTRLQQHNLIAWRDGQFIADYDPAPPPAAPGPAALDRAALEPCVGGGWYPGIESGVLMTNPQIYSEFCRLGRAAFADAGEQVVPRPGYLTERMACPWQADFWECSGSWWPAQRPDKLFTGFPPAHTGQDWADGIQDHEDLVANFWKLGLATPGGTGPDGLPAYFETERDPSMPRAV